MALPHSNTKDRKWRDLAVPAMFGNDPRTDLSPSAGVRQKTTFPPTTSRLLTSPRYGWRGVSESLALFRSLVDVDDMPILERQFCP